MTIYATSFPRTKINVFKKREEAKKAGIRTVMITGDHKVTATAIARQIGIYKDGDITVTGQELDAMSDEELDRQLERISVYARVSERNSCKMGNRLFDACRSEIP